MPYTHTEENEFFVADLFRREWNKLVRYAKIQMRRYGAYPRDLDGRAEDIVQEVFLSACNKIEEIKALQRPESWLYLALYYKIQEAMREDKRWEQGLAALTLAGEQHHEDERQILEQLIPKRDLDLLIRLYKEGYKYEELATKMGTTKTALAMRVCRIKKKFRKNYEKFQEQC